MELVTFISLFYSTVLQIIGWVTRLLWHLWMGWPLLLGYQSTWQQYGSGIFNLFGCYFKFLWEMGLILPFVATFKEKKVQIFSMIYVQNDTLVFQHQLVCYHMLFDVRISNASYIIHILFLRATFLNKPSSSYIQDIFLLQSWSIVLLVGLFKNSSGHTYLVLFFHYSA